MTLSLSGEEALLVEVAGGRRAAPAGSDTIDWQRLLDLAEWHRLLPLLWDHLRTARTDVDVPPEVTGELQEISRDTAARNVRLLRERDRALEVLARHDVPVILLKGAALMTSVYGHVAQRPMVDVDLLVPERDVRRAHETLAEGLRYAVAGARLERDDEARLDESHHHFPLVSPDRAVLIELHHRIVDDRPGWDVAGIWERAQVVDAQPPYRLQAPEDLMLHVASHFAFDRIHRAEGALGQLADLVRIDRRWTIDWDAVAERARAAQVADRLFLALMTSTHLFGDVAPAQLIETLAPGSFTPERGERFVRQRVLRGGPALPLEQLSIGRRRLLARSDTLEQYLDPDEPVPSRAVLRVRRWRALAGRLVREAPTPPELLDDIRLSRWILSLRR